MVSTRIVPEIKLKCLIGSTPGLLDPTQPARVLRGDGWKLSFAILDPVVLGEAVTPGASTEADGKRRIVIETPPLGAGALRYRLVPNAELDPGVENEGSWPRTVDICGEIVVCSQEQWYIHKLDPAYHCCVRQSPLTPKISRREMDPRNINGKRRNSDSGDIEHLSKRFRTTLFLNEEEVEGRSEGTSSSDPLSRPQSTPDMNVKDLTPDENNDDTDATQQVPADHSDSIPCTVDPTDAEPWASMSVLDDSTASQLGYVGSESGAGATGITMVQPQEGGRAAGPQSSPFPDPTTDSSAQEGMDLDPDLTGDGQHGPPYSAEATTETRPTDMDPGAPTQECSEEEVDVPARNIPPERENPDVPMDLDDEEVPTEKACADDEDVAAGSEEREGRPSPKRPRFMSEGPRNRTSERAAKRTVERRSTRLANKQRGKVEERRERERADKLWDDLLAGRKRTPEAATGPQRIDYGRVSVEQDDYERQRVDYERERVNHQRVNHQRVNVERVNVERVNVERVDSK
ncbi:hypothetical protein BD309DRAFT_1024452 [Dichomitus squalens]|nr:hypothetical protein BD309DRAFT_1024452 [Dichomitus squalens]